MASGVAPKLPSERKNTSPPKRGEWIEIDTFPIGDDECTLPSIEEMDASEWTDHMSEAWNSWRHDPVTIYYSHSDIQLAKDTIRLYKQFMGKAAEIRLRLDSLGLTPKGKQDRRIKVKPRVDGVSREMTKEVKVDAESTSAPPRVASIEDARKRLSRAS